MLVKKWSNLILSKVVHRPPGMLVGYFELFVAHISLNKSPPKALENILVLKWGQKGVKNTFFQQWYEIIGDAEICGFRLFSVIIESFWLADRSKTPGS